MKNVAVGISCAVNALGNTPAKTDTPEPSSRFQGESQLELDIEAAKQRMCDAPTRPEKMSAWREMCRLIDQRTPSRVRFMERMRGIS